MMDSNQLSGNKRQFSYIIKFILLIFVSYFMVQISIVAKEREEKRNIPGLQTTIELADEYMKRKYIEDWEILGDDLDYPDGYLTPFHTLKFSSDVGKLTVFSDFIYTVMKKGNSSIEISMNWDEDWDDWLLIINGEYQGHSTTYYFDCKNGRYIPNPQMEQETGFTMDEIINQVDKMRTAFEEEMEKMRQYQIGREKEWRKRFANFGFITFLLFCTAYLLIKWAVINKRANAEDKYPEEVLKETIAKEKVKLFKRRYLLIGCAVSFWIYILVPIISEYVLIPIRGNANEYTAYGISAVITAVVLGLLWESPAVEKKNESETVRQAVRNIVWFLSGCVGMLAVIWIGLSIVPQLNLLADGIAFFIFIMIEAAKRPAAGVGHDGTMAMEKGV